MAPRDTFYIRPLLSTSGDIADLLNIEKQHRVRRQKNIFQTKEQDKTSENYERDKESDIEYKVTVIKMLIRFERSIQAQ